MSRGTQVPSVPLSISNTGLSPSMARFSNLFVYLIMDHVMTVLQPHPPRRVGGLGWFPFARRYLGNHFCFLFLGLLRCFSSPRSPQQPMDSAEDVATLPATGFPIQKSPGQSLFSSSPKLIAAFHVFHRLLTPRHPPFALNSLATKYLTQILRTQCYFNSTSKLSKSKKNRQCSAFLVEVNGFEPMTSCVQGRRSPS